MFGMGAFLGVFFMFHNESKHYLVEQTCVEKIEERMIP